MALPSRTDVNRYPLILKGVMEGLSGRQILGALLENGMGLRSQNFYRYLGSAKVEVAGREEILGLGPNERPNRANLPPWPTKSEEGFHHIVQFITRNRITGEYETNHVTIGSGTLLTRAEAEEEAQRILAENEDKYPEMAIEGWSQVAIRTLVPEG